MSSLRGGDAVRRAAGRLRETLARPGVRPAVAAYFDPAEGFAGMTFATLGDNPPDQLTAADLLAVSLLDITWRPDVVRRLLGTDRDRFAGLLAGISTGVDLWQATDADLGAVDLAWDTLLDIPGVGTASAAKLLARKRPRLCPITDKVVIRAAGLPGLTWEVLRCLLQDPGARAEVEALRPPEAAGASLLRILDVAIWVTQSNSRGAQRVRLVGGDRAA
jgi:Family of unknown function (DUF6308)